MCLCVFKIEGEREEGGGGGGQKNRDTKTCFVAQGCPELMLPRLAPPALYSGVL